ncbi:hypothetical protein D018_1139B, partial [Vibrio parahaemolyticus VP2007-007]
ASCLG